MKHVFGLMKSASEAQARLDIQWTKTILSSKKRLFILFLMTLPVLIVSFGYAGNPAELLPDKIPILGGSKAFMPSFIDSTMFFGSILIGLIAGLITGVIGAGGGYILTPALMSFGVRGIMAVGTDQFHIFAKAIMGTVIHRKLGNVHVGLAVWFVVGSMVGVTIGGYLSRSIFLFSPALSDAVISVVYLVVLGSLGIYAILDWKKAGKSSHEGQDRTRESTTDFARLLQKKPLPPRVTFDQNIVPGGRKLSVYPIIFCGFVVGFVASIMGVGGGFLTFPMFVYGLGVSTFTTVGTDILQIIFTTCYSSIFQYAIYGFVFYSIAMGMLLGSLVGVQIGAMVTEMVKGSQIRAFYALTILGGFANRFCALPRKLGDLGYIAISRDVSVYLETFGNVLFFVLVGGFALWILLIFFQNVSTIRERSDDRQLRDGRPFIINARKFKIGIAGLAAFCVVFTVSFFPMIGQKTALQWADGLFNGLAKNSADYHAESQKAALKFKGTNIDLGIRPRDFADGPTLVKLIGKNGAEARIAPDGRVRIQGDLGRLAEAALADAALVFHNQDQRIEAQYQMPGTEVLYCWWIIFDGLTRRYIQDNRGAEAAFSKIMTGKILEPAYNFRNIEPSKIGDHKLPVLLLLGFYILYTIWYGLSIMFIFEGLGISAGKPGNKAEA
ncbi:MAG: sulfite exporter TauE/SafE family protein [Deltaproteobacteria bacterium]|nr:sulfite exporter TauE/SafE family protein [Deltaproteobacteria bacterium]